MPGQGERSCAGRCLPSGGRPPTRYRWTPSGDRSRTGSPALLPEVGDEGGPQIAFCGVRGLACASLPHQHAEGVARVLEGATGSGSRRGREHALRPSLPAHRLLRPLPAHRAPPSCQRQLRHRARRVHPARPRASTRSTTRPTARAPGRREPQPVLELRAEGETDDPAVWNCAPVSNATSWPPCCSRRASRCDHGDELGRTQRGNSNAYCQDNDVSSIDWRLTDGQRDLVDFTRHVIGLRAVHPVLRRRRSSAGRP
ncbi:Glycogen debranching enzyme [Streptomyces alboniger]